MKRDWYRIEAKAQQDAADVYIFGDIGKSFWDDDTVTASKFIADLTALPESVKAIRVHVNSYGGSVFEAHAIANALRDQRASKGRAVETIIEGIAASAATIITSAGSPIKIADNAMMMVHDPSAIEYGTAKAFRKMADALDGIRNSIIAAYRWVSSKTEDELSAMMAESTWMDPAEAVAAGLATEIVQGVQATACLAAEAVGRLGDVPERFQARIDALVEKPAPPPPAPEPAAAADVLRICREGECLDLAEDLVTSGATLDQVTARVGQEKQARAEAATRATQIRALCAQNTLPELADGYIKGAMSIDDIKAHLVTLTARLDHADIDGSLPPDQGGTPKAGINASAIYAERNRLKKE